MSIAQRYIDGLKKAYYENDGMKIWDAFEKVYKLAEENIGVQISPDDTDTLGSIYMWVPRFAYNEAREIVYIKKTEVSTSAFPVFYFQYSYSFTILEF